jgi:hypothetical protein
MQRASIIYIHKLYYCMEMIKIPEYCSGRCFFKATSQPTTVPLPPGAWRLQEYSELKVDIKFHSYLERPIVRENTHGHHDIT